jgi:putative DNA primase/helicase
MEFLIPDSWGYQDCVKGQHLWTNFAPNKTGPFWNNGWKMKLFTQTELLRSIGHIRLAKFLEAFHEDLRQADVVLPPAPDPAYPVMPEPNEKPAELGSPYAEQTRYFAGLAEIFTDWEKMGGTTRSTQCTQGLLRLIGTMLTVEAAASDEPRLDAIIQRRLPCVAVNLNCALDRALELWFAVPEELEQFRNGGMSNGEVRVSNQEARRSKIEESSRPAEAGTPNTDIPNGDRGHPETPNAFGAVAGTPNMKIPKGDNTPAQESDEQTFWRLAALTLVEYDRVRKAEAARLGIRVATLNLEVVRCRAQLNEEANARNVNLLEIEPWPEPVNGVEVLHEVSSRYTRVVILPSGAADAISLWTAHSHAYEAWAQTPRLNLSSPESGCGKTTTMDVLASMTPRALRTENLTAPTLFRVVDQHKPTLLLDEVDSYINQAEELRGLINAGHKRGGCAYRCEGEGMAVKAFKAFAPAVLAGIGPLPGTLHDRSIVILLVKAEPGQITARFDEQKAEVEWVLARKLARWTKDNFEALRACDPKLPETAFNRRADNWRPLFAIAEVAGGEWPARVLAAFNQLTATVKLESQDTGVRLLHDIRDIFERSGVDRIRSNDLVRSLCSVPDGPWPKANRGNKAITERWLANRLRRFGIASQTMRVEDRQAKGYALADFREAFAKYLG